MLYQWGSLNGTISSLLYSPTALPVAGKSFVRIAAGSAHFGAVSSGGTIALCSIDGGAIPLACTLFPL